MVSELDISTLAKYILYSSKLQQSSWDITPNQAIVMISGPEYDLMNSLIAFESRAAQIYERLAFYYSEDYQFWIELSDEEKHHAKILRKGRDSLIGKQRFPEEFLKLTWFTAMSWLERMDDILARLADQTKRYSREEAFTLGLRIEECAVEMIFEQLTRQLSDKDAVLLFQQLNDDSYNHAERIQAYMSKLGFSQ